MTQRMSQLPDPAKAGGSVDIYYDTSGCTFPLHLIVYGEPCGSRQEFPIEHTTYLPLTIALPEGCTGGQVVDSSSQSDTYAIAITP